jgi:predicted ArsR family transcriptional regulator
VRNFDRSVTGIGVLADPVRRQLYRFVCSQDQPVSRDQAAQAVGIARHKAKFHLDRLEAEGLLEADYVRLSGRAGPGAGRPTKRYRRGRSELPFPFRRETTRLAGRIMADAISYALCARRTDREAVRRALAQALPSPLPAQLNVVRGRRALELVVRILNDHGYEPRRVDHTVVMMNCPFHALAVSYTDLVCQMNHALLSSFADSLTPELLDANFEPGDNRCCVTLTALPATEKAATAPSKNAPEGLESA